MKVRPFLTTPPPNPLFKDNSSQYLRKHEKEMKQKHTHIKFNKNECQVTEDVKPHSQHKQHVNDRD